MIEPMTALDLENRHAAHAQATHGRSPAADRHPDWGI
jgi:hypothetical protein